MGIDHHRGVMPIGFSEQGRHELVRAEDGIPVELGRGAMGVTYKAFDVDLRCPVAFPSVHLSASSSTSPASPC